MSGHTTWINGAAISHIEATDRGLQYGDGVFETMRLQGGDIPLWSYHWLRLKNSCERLCIRLPDRNKLEEFLAPALAEHEQGIIKLLVTRGSSGRGYRIDPKHVASIVVMYFEPPGAERQLLASEGIRVRLCHTRLAIQPLLAGIKHLNRLEQVMARSEWDNNDVHEGLMCNWHGELVEGTMSNLFVVKNNTLLTPVLNNSGVSGVMRELVLNIAEQMAINCEESVLFPEQMQDMDEVFMTNSINGIWPVVEFENCLYPVGPVTQGLQAELKQRFCY